MIALAIAARARARTHEWNTDVTLAHLNAWLGRAAIFPSLDKFLKREPTERRKPMAWQQMLKVAETFVASVS